MPSLGWMKWLLRGELVKWLSSGIGVAWTDGQFCRCPLADCAVADISLSKKLVRIEISIVVADHKSCIGRVNSI